MNLQKKLNPRYILPLAFGIPFIGMLVVMAACGYEPFGDAAILYSDNYHQYYPFFVAFREALRSGDSLLYSWDVGLGMDYLGLISYYLASPLYLLSVLVPEVWLLEFYCLLTPVRLGLAGLFFAIFLKHTFQKEDLSVAVFAAFYAFCAWTLGYMWNVMWLDTFALTPLVVLGTISLLRDRKFILYTLTLFLAVYANYYIGFFVCIFVLLVCICWEICRFSGFKRLIADIGVMAAFSLLAVGMTAILELPTLAALQNTQSSVNTFPTGFAINMGSDDWMGLLEAMAQVAGNMGGGTEPTFKEGLPNIYCGVGTLAMAILYFLAKDVKIREKICAFVMLVFLMLSFIIRQLDYIWHGFHFTNMIPYRFSFLYSFVMLYMAYRAWTLRATFRWWQILLTGVWATAFLCLSNNISELVFLLYNGVLLLLYMFFMFLGVSEEPVETDDPEEAEIQIRERAEQHHTLTIYLVILLCAELILNLVNFATRFPGTSVTHYPRGTTYAASMMDYMQEREADTLFYRAETTHSQTLNDGALNGYNGISTFTSSANVKVTEFMRCLGYGAKNTYNRYCFEEASPVSNLFLGLKYMIDRESRDRASSQFTAIHTYESVTLLENNAYLPLGFLAEPELAEVVFDYDTDFGFQNQLFSAATGLSQDVWEYQDDLLIYGEDVTITNLTEAGYCAYTGALQNGTINYQYIVEDAGFLCIQLDCPKRNNITISHNGEVVMTESLSLPQMLAVCDVELGDLVEIRADCAAGESGNMTITAAVLDANVFWQGYNVLSQSTLELTSFKNTRVEGTISCHRDGLLYTSIPQNGNWSVQVDGQPAEVTLVGDVMTGVELTEGDHTITFTYKNPAFSLGWKISALSLVIFLLAAGSYIRKHPKRGKYQK